MTDAFAGFSDARPGADEARWTRTSAVLSIARLAALTGATPRALRHYQQEDLLQCHRTRSGQRLYAPADVERALTIVWLRSLDLSIAEIRDLLGPGSAANAPDRLRRRLRERIDALDRERRVASRTLAALEIQTDGSFDLIGLRDAVAGDGPPRPEAVQISSTARRLRRAAR